MWHIVGGDQHSNKMSGAPKPGRRYICGDTSFSRMNNEIFEVCKQMLESTGVSCYLEATVEFGLDFPDDMTLSDTQPTSCSNAHVCCLFAVPANASYNQTIAHDA